MDTLESPFLDTSSLLKNATLWLVSDKQVQLAYTSCIESVKNNILDLEASQYIDSFMYQPRQDYLQETLLALLVVCFFLVLGMAIALVYMYMQLQKLKSTGVDKIRLVGGVQMELSVCDWYEPPLSELLHSD